MAQIRAIAFALDIGKKLQDRYGRELAHAYHQGNSLTTIVRTYDLCVEYGLTPTLARRAVQAAFSGHGGSYGVPAYDGLIPEDELLQLAQAHWSANGNRTRKEKIGIFGRTLEKRVEDAAAAGTASHALKRGVHGLDTPQLKEYGAQGYATSIGKMSKRAFYAQAIRKALLARGLVPWSAREKRSALLRAQDLRHRQGKKYRAADIAAELNDLYHGGKPVRNATAISHFISHNK